MPRSLQSEIGSSGHHNTLPDYHEIYDRLGNWNEIAKYTQVFGLLQDATQVMKMDDANGMNSLAEGLKKRGLKITIEAGGLRPTSNEQCG